MATSRVPAHLARSLHRRTRLILSLLIIGFAFALRAAPIRGGRPYLRYIDEGHVLHDSIAMLQRHTFDTGFYNYPALPSYMIAGALSLYAPTYNLTHNENFWTELQRGEDAAFYDYFAPTDVILVGRIVVLLFSVGIVVLAGILGNAIGGTRCGLLSAFLAAICPALVSRGSIVIVDPIATFFALACLCFCQRLFQRDAKLWPLVVAASATAGLAFVSKYTAGAVFVAVCATIMLLPKSWPEKLRFLLLSGAVLIVTSVAAMPTLLTSSVQIFNTLRSVTLLYRTLPFAPGYFNAAVLPGELGPTLVIAGVLGIALMLKSAGPARLVAISWIAFAFVLIAALVRIKFQPFRNLLPLVPPLCISAAFLITHLHLLVRHGIARRVIAPIAALGLVLSLAIPAWKDVRYQRAISDSRVRALNWLGKNSEPHDRILAVRELAIHPAEWKRIGRQPTVVSWLEARDLLERETFDHLVGSEFNPQFAPDQQFWLDYRERWIAKTSTLPVEKTFGKVPCFLEPGVWRTNDERIVIQRGTTR